MKKIRLIRTTIVEYVPEPSYYPEGSTIKQMAEIDMQQDDRELTFDNNISDEIRYEIIDED